MNAQQQKSSASSSIFQLPWALGHSADYNKWQVVGFEITPTP